MLLLRECCYVHVIVVIYGFVDIVICSCHCLKHHCGWPDRMAGKRGEEGAAVL